MLYCCDMGRNDLLAALLAEAGYSHKGLADRVRELAARDGRRNSADHVTVGRWLHGSTPRPQTARYIAMALSQKLARPVSLSEIGVMADAAGSAVTGDGPGYPGEVARSVDWLAALSRADLEDQSAVETLGWDTSSPASVMARFVYGTAVGTAATAVSTRPIGSITARRIRDTAAHLMELDFKVGGGSTRRLLLFYFSSEVVPALRRHCPDPEREDVFSSAAEVAQLLGWTAYDAGRHGAAQRYFMQALRLADEANDRLLGGRLLANLSHQANYLGRFDDALHFARAAQAATLQDPVATVSSMFLAMEARALAGAGRSRESVQALSRAEHVFERRDSGRDPGWISYFDREELAGEAAHCFRDLGRSAEARLFGAEANAGLAPVRTRAFVGMVNAAATLRAGDLDEALALASVAMEEAQQLRSQRYVRYLGDFCNALTAGYAAEPQVDAFVRAAGAVGRR